MAMLPQLSRCCCGCTLHTGTLFIGAYQLVRGLLEFICDLMLELTGSFNRARDGWVYIFQDVPMISSILGIVRMIAAVFLIVSANKERPRLVFSWLIFIAVFTILSFVLFPLTLASFYFYSGSTEFVMTLLLGLLDFGLELYFMLVVNSYYRTIREGATAPQSHSI